MTESRNCHPSDVPTLHWNNIKRVSLRTGSAVIIFTSWISPDGNHTGVLALNFELYADFPEADRAAEAIVRRIFPEHD